MVLISSLWYRNVLNALLCMPCSQCPADWFAKVPTSYLQGKRPLCSFALPLKLGISAVSLVWPGLIFSVGKPRRIHLNLHLSAIHTYALRSYMAVGKKHWTLSSNEHGGVFDHAINYWQCAALNIGKTSHLFLPLCHPITTSLFTSPRIRRAPASTREQTDAVTRASPWLWLVEGLRSAPSLWQILQALENKQWGSLSDECFFHVSLWHLCAYVFFHIFI